MLFRSVSEEEAEEFRAWARANWEPGKACPSDYHPLVRHEWARLDLESPRVMVPDRITDGSVP